MLNPTDAAASAPSELIFKSDDYQLRQACNQLSAFRLNGYQSGERRTGFPLALD
jgi:hypothetical protein